MVGCSISNPCIAVDPSQVVSIDAVSEDNIITGTAINGVIGHSNIYCFKRTRFQCDIKLVLIVHYLCITGSTAIGNVIPTHTCICII